MGYIYLITNKINGKQYVGQTIREDIYIRWKQHKNNTYCNMPISKAYNKYGINNFKFQIICICFDEDCNKFEKEYIKKFNTISPNGYNLREGGDNSRHHPETIKKLSEIMREKWRLTKHPCIGLKYSDKYKKKMSDSVKKALEEKKLNGYTQNIICLNNLIEASEKRKRKVAQFSKEDILIKEFNSISEAETYTNINNRRISEVCNMKSKTAGGYIWKFI